MKKITTFCLLIFVFVCPVALFAQSAGDYRSAVTGYWSVAAIWQIYNSGWGPASHYPTSTDGVITILNTHAVTVDLSVSGIIIDHLVVATGGILTTSGGVGFTIGSSNTINGSFIIPDGSSVTVGTINVNGVSITLTSGSIYDSQIIFNGTSTLTIPSGGGLLSNILINSGTTTLTSPDPTGTMNGLVYVANNAVANLSIASGKVFTFNSDLIVRTTGTINGPGTITYSGTSVTYGFVNNGTVSADVKFSGSGLLKILASDTYTSNWINVEINDANGVTADWLGGTPTVTINGILKLTNGKFSLGGNTLTIGSSGSISGYSSSCYIVTDGTTGYLVRNVPTTDTDVLFPVGTTTTYNPLILNNYGATADNYSVRVTSSTTNVEDANGS